jgi:exonuclease VII small subunit
MATMDAMKELREAMRIAKRREIKINELELKIMEIREKMEDLNEPVDDCLHNLLVLLDKNESQLKEKAIIMLDDAEDAVKKRQEFMTEYNDLFVELQKERIDLKVEYDLIKIKLLKDLAKRLLVNPDKIDKETAMKEIDNILDDLPM